MMAIRAVLLALLLSYTVAIETPENNTFVAYNQLKPDLNHVSVSTASVAQKQHLKPQTAAITGAAPAGAAVPTRSKVVHVVSSKASAKQQLSALQGQKPTAAMAKTVAKQQSSKAAYDDAEYSKEYAGDSVYGSENEEREW
jgi:Neuraminidase (sialidase)